MRTRMVLVRRALTTRSCCIWSGQTTEHGFRVGGVTQSGIQGVELGMDSDVPR